MGRLLTKVEYFKTNCLNSERINEVCMYEMKWKGLETKKLQVGSNFRHDIDITVGCTFERQKKASCETRDGIHFKSRYNFLLASLFFISRHIAFLKSSCSSHWFSLLCPKPFLFLAPGSCPLGKNSYG